MKIRKFLFVIFLFTLVLTIFTGCPTIVVNPVSNPYNNIQTGVSASFAPNETWTFMIYLDADNNLEQDAIVDFNEMVSGLNSLGNPNINVVILIDRIDGYDSTNYLTEASDWTGARIYQINQDGTYTKKTDGWFTDGDEINMGDKLTLISFINYCKTNYVAQHYALILWNHGGGARNKSINFTDDITRTVSQKEVCVDDTSTGDALYLDEIQQAINFYFNSTNKLDFLGFDACLMGMVEVAYEFRNLALVMAGSMANEWNYGWDYNALFKGMTLGTNNDPKELGKLVVKTYHDSTVNQPDQTQAAFDLTKVSALKTEIDSFAVKIYKENLKSQIQTARDNAIHFYSTNDESIVFPFFDLNDLAVQINANIEVFSEDLRNQALNVIDSLSEVVIAAYAGSDYGNYYGPGSDVKRGLSIFFSRGNLTVTTSSATYSHYSTQWWYTNEDVSILEIIGHGYGKIDFANSNANGVVEYWRELFEAWYDSNNTYTPSTY